MESLGLLEYRNPYLHCTPEPVSDIPAPDHADGQPARLRDVWFRTMAQMFTGDMILHITRNFHALQSALYPAVTIKKCELRPVI